MSSPKNPLLKIFHYSIQQGSNTRETAIPIKYWWVYDGILMLAHCNCINELCFFLLFTGSIFSSCLRVAYALPTPLRCFPTRGLFVLICLRVPTLTSCFLILPTRLACVASVGFLLVLIRRILPTRWAPVLSVEVVFFVLLGIATPGCRQNIYKLKCKDVKPHVSYHNNKTQLPISQQNSSSNTAYAEKNINQHPQNAYEKPTRASEMPTPALHKTYFV